MAVQDSLIWSYCENNFHSLLGLSSRKTLQVYMDGGRSFWTFFPQSWQRTFSVNLGDVSVRSLFMVGVVGATFGRSSLNLGNLLFLGTFPAA